ncbi:GNAT family N-acetyltransferase [Streptomyces sp. NPDC017993]|uniref:GNAT family N-acetyltransferase n=1 Tax=Streptomyces sp. NPDC017993 TaxID=3365027 RepID=UPI0037AD12F7
MTGPLAATGGPLAHPSPSGLSPVLHAWVDGWARSRRTDAPREAAGGFRIEVGLPNHLARYVLPAADPAALRDLVGSLTTPGLWIKVCAPREAVESLLTPAWQISEPQYLMTAPLAPLSTAARPPGYRLDVTYRDGVYEARLLAAEGTADTAAPAASGRAALTAAVPGLAPYAPSVVFDMIGTDPAHRRRGLGRFLMASLAGRAAERGARQGVLVASPDGRALYEATGWRLRSPVTAAVLTG